MSVPKCLVLRPTPGPPSVASLPWVLDCQALPTLMGLQQGPGGLCSLPVFVLLKDQAYGQR